MPASRFIAHTVPFVWTPATTGSTALTAYVGVEGRVWGIEVTGMQWGKTWTLATVAASAASSHRVTMYSALGTTLLCSTTIASADPRTAAPCSHFFGVGASASTVFVTPTSYIRYSAWDDNVPSVTDYQTERVVSGAAVCSDELPRASVVLYVET